jgi:N-acetylglucosamine malate deacetylase 1
MDKKLGIIMSLLSAISCSGKADVMEHQKILVFAPHPDDDIIGCGGSIAKHIKQGNSVSIVYMTSGEACDGKQDKKEIANTREEEAKAAATILGVESLYFLRNPDGKLIYDQNKIATIVEIIRKEKPQIVYAPHARDGHRDHKATYRLVVDAITYAAGNTLQKYSGEPWHVQRLLCYEVWTPISHCDHSEDISEFIDIKLAALRNHQSQIANCRYDQAIEGLNRYRGEMQRLGKYCECFTVTHFNE